MRPKHTINTYRRPMRPYPTSGPSPTNPTRNDYALPMPTSRARHAYQSRVLRKPANANDLQSSGLTGPGAGPPKGCTPMGQTPCANFVGNSLGIDLILVPLLEILDGAVKGDEILARHSEHGIAGAAKDSTDLAGLMIVIDMPETALVIVLKTDCTTTKLGLQ